MSAACHSAFMPDAKYDSASVALAPGDWLIVFTDGLVEAVNAREEDFDEPRLLNAIQAGASGTPKQLLDRLMNDLDLFVGNTPQHDDITCLLVKAESV
jgi:phosphoserine phosphatase RsbU/P